jgi:hypothetical protein
MCIVGRSVLLGDLDRKPKAEAVTSTYFKESSALNQMTTNSPQSQSQKIRTSKSAVDVAATHHTSSLFCGVG